MTKTLGQLWFLTLLWLGAASCGATLLWCYALTPGTESATASLWPADTTLRRHGDAPTLLVFLHPKCPCSRATIRELAEILHRSRNVHEAQVIIYKPSGTDSAWEHTDLWQSAARLPGVALSIDRDGREAMRFSAATSGHCLLYSAKGRLLFSGGITYARGHEGANEGKAALVSIIGNEQTSFKTPVFGCPLFSKSPSSAR